ncbi:hypothetical protein BT63DRAFT_459683 [Microthyrium microscopicum]|uniref:Uncharacterized protein n=1 Tax=Microthyrium microscopicum TaxID=703497 RepID=A0A6A6TZ00_9PEZI|nr:hypothetical protein BT63DRAFT_459683 [Microthyrium microscopicum]
MLKKLGPQAYSLDMRFRASIFLVIILLIIKLPLWIDLLIVTVIFATCDLPTCSTTFVLVLGFKFAPLFASVSTIAVWLYVWGWRGWKQEILRSLSTLSLSIIGNGDPTSTGPMHCAEYVQSLSYTFNKHLFGVTLYKYARLFPLSAKPGDKIAILHGCNVPFLLRRVESDKKEFFLVGECYVHGIMLGEAFESELFPVEDISLI